MNRKQQVLEELERAHRQRVNLGAEPRDVPHGLPSWGWVTGIHFVTHGGGTRYGARIHELRHEDGIEVVTFNERRDGVVIPFYRLKDDVRPETQPEPAGTALFEMETANSYGRD